ncbi:MAG: hypothetical protein KIT83_15415 [Bryobacterales bacterium]|nr:hypothetical protein [Bryobacterales bacterium]
MLHCVFHCVVAQTGRALGSLVVCILLIQGGAGSALAQQVMEAGKPASQQSDGSATDSEDNDEEAAASRKVVPELQYKQHPGLAYAASKIYFSDQKYAVSGFGEINAIRYRGESNRDSGDIELFYTNLYRFSTFFGYKFTNNLIFNSEFLGEFIHDGTREYGTDIVIEAMLDYLIHPRFNTRFGFFPLPMGYLNNNDEPVMFNSVNRPEVERVIIPSSWIMLGTMAFGKVAGNLSYSAGIVGGLDGSDFVEGTWIRQGRQIHHGIPKDFASVGQLLYRTGEDIQFGVSAYRGASGVDGTEDALERVRMPTTVFSAHGRYHKPRFSITGVATQGQLGRTAEAFERIGQVMGSRTYGYYLEADHDILPYFLKQAGNRRLKVFARTEWLNTHARTDAALLGRVRNEQDLRIVTIGANYAPKRSFVFKGNYQFRTNRFANAPVPESDVAEFGVGFIF